MFECIIGIDCGATGGIAILYDGQRKVHKMPEDLKQVDELLKYYQQISETMLVVIEHVQIMPHDIHNNEAKKFGRAVRMQKLLDQYSQFKAIMQIAGIPYITVTPKTWINYLNLKTPKKWDRTQRKRHYRDWAQHSWPQKLSISVADAVCILIYTVRSLKFDPDFMSKLPKNVKNQLFK